MHIRVIHGPNLNLLGVREESLYGMGTLEEVNHDIRVAAESLGAVCSFFQSNLEGELVTAIQQVRDDAVGILINPGAYTHTSVAIRDALLAVDVPCVEVHMSNTYAREAFRHTSTIADIVIGRILGFGAQSYVLGLQALVNVLSQPKPR